MQGKRIFDRSTVITESVLKYMSIKLSPDDTELLFRIDGRRTKLQEQTAGAPDPSAFV
jgi:hypothetical protein